VGSVYGIWNWKGGVTKTSSTLNIASHMVADHGLRVVAVDFDPRSTLTRLAGLDPGALKPSQTMLGALLPEEYGAISARDLLREAPWGGHLLAASPDLAGAEPVLAELPGPHGRLRRALEEIREEADVVLIDGPPRTGKLAFNLMGACDGLFVPVALSYASVTSLERLFKTVRIFCEYEREVPVLGVFGTLARPTRHARETLVGLLDQLGELVVDVAVPNTVSVEDALVDGLAAWQLQENSLGARAYTELTNRVLQRMSLAGGVA